MISPQLTKIHYQFYSGSTLNIVFKEVDFEDSDITDITFQSQAQFLITTSKINAFTKANYFLGDNFVAIRNDSSVSTPNTGIFVEEAYSFMS
jgi:tRNA U34 5-methylaminomethyl-2-thiouridine-forming methyltransferase MnmC